MWSSQLFIIGQECAHIDTMKTPRLIYMLWFLYTSAATYVHALQCNRCYNVLYCRKMVRRTRASDQFNETPEKRFCYSGPLLWHFFVATASSSSSSSTITFSWKKRNAQQFGQINKLILCVFVAFRNSCTPNAKYRTESSSHASHEPVNRSLLLSF